MIGGGPNSYKLFTFGPPTSPITGSGRAASRKASRHLQVTVTCGEANFKKGGHSKRLCYTVGTRAKDFPGSSERTVSYS